ncbi:MAG: UbiA family prenyltransferase, partial [Burkholderiales bacterium]|nr:UbiA family prenyltransferase [Burkholderiales bacterium]
MPETEVKFPARHPLVVDLDGTLTPTDTLVESVFRLLKQSFLNIFLLPFWLLQGRAALKRNIAAKVKLSAAGLPYNPELLAYLRAEKQAGRKIFLATAAHESIAQAVAAHLDLFDGVLASDEGVNLKGSAKLQAIRTQIDGRFVYAGDSRADIPIWQSAQAAVLVGVSPALAEAIGPGISVEKTFQHGSAGIGTWLRALRVHQWVKNLLLFVPLLTAYSFLDVGSVFRMVLAFFAFSFCASATYLMNDLWDLDSDRAHPRKRMRPFASALIPLLHGVAMALVFMCMGFALALAVSKAFVLILVLYVILTTTYSWVLKEYVLVDVLMLALLYTLRIFAGAVAIQVSTSSWLLAFSVFVFLSLALVKRCSELVSLGEGGQKMTRGRDYRVTDLVILWPLGMGAALSAVVVFGLFISAPETQHQYATPTLLWFVALALIYWLSRLWIKTSRAEMHDDP